tara:strand:+ start:401 stop:1441 length:1041 start_codon:yes stop_codon:yes gene_type:complete
MTTLVTGAAGFIGFHLAKRLINSGLNVVGFDNINSYYDINLKLARLKELENISDVSTGKFSFVKGDLEDYQTLNQVFNNHEINKVVNLAAQAGVRYSIENPMAYIQSNLVGFGNILEACRHNKIQHLVYASSSSVYGGNTKMPFSERDGVDHPISIYAATKKSNELMAHAYSHLYELPTTGLRFFTVYGPWGRPDMALFLFTKAIISGKPIDIFNNGEMIRDFTYIDDIIESLVRVIDKPPTKNQYFDFKTLNPSKSWSPFKVFNIGNSNPINLMSYVKSIEDCLSKKAIINFLPMQPGDVSATSADTHLLEEWINFKPNTSINKGIEKFIEWFINFYSVKQSMLN